MMASSHRISPFSTVSESQCPWYSHNDFRTSLISSGHPAMIMSARTLSSGSSVTELVILFLLTINVCVIDGDV